MVREELLKHWQRRNVEAIIRRTPPHLLNQHNRKHFNMKESASTIHPTGSSSINHTKTSDGNYDHLGSLPMSLGGSSSLPQNHGIYTGIVAQEGRTQGYLYLPKLSPIIPKASATSSSSCEEGTPMANGNPSEHLRSLPGGNKPVGSNSRTEDYQLPHQLSSFYPVIPHTNGGNNWNHFQHQQLAHHHCNQPGTDEQLPLPSCLSSQNTTSNTAHTRPTSSSVLGKRPAVSKHPPQSFSPPPLSPPTDVDHMPQCRIETDELLSLVQSFGTSEFLSNLEKVLGSRSSPYKPGHDATVVALVGGNSTVSAPSLLLGSGNSNGDEKEEGKEVRSYWDLSTMAETMEPLKKQRLEADQSLPELTLGLDGQGCSKNTMQHRPWN